MFYDWLETEVMHRQSQRHYWRGYHKIHSDTAAVLPALAVVAVATSMASCRVTAGLLEGHPTVIDGYRIFSALA